MNIRILNKSEIKHALELVWETFLEYEAPDYVEGGIITFRGFINNLEFINELKFYGAFEQGELQGVIATRLQGSHIALFFVKGKSQGKGIGRRLFEEVQKNCTNSKITVNSSPYAVPIYHKLGFIDTSSEQLTDGIRYTPMEKYV